MLPYVVLIGAAVLGAVSIVMIVWSLRSRGRDQGTVGRTGGQAAITEAGPPSNARWEPAPPPVPVTTGLTQVADVSDDYDPAAPEPPTEFLPPEDEIPTQFMAPDELFGDEHEAKTEFMREDELFGDEHEANTQLMREDELFDDEHEANTQLMREDQLFGDERGLATGPAEGPSHDQTIVLEAEAEPATCVPPGPSGPPPPASRPAPAKPPPSPRPASSGPQQFSMFVRDGTHEQPSRDPAPPADFDDEEDDPETALVHQSELMHVIAGHKADKDS